MNEKSSIKIFMQFSINGFDNFCFFFITVYFWMKTNKFLISCFFIPILRQKGFFSLQRNGKTASNIYQKLSKCQKEERFPYPEI